MFSYIYNWLWPKRVESFKINPDEGEAKSIRETGKMIPVMIEIDNYFPYELIQMKYTFRKETTIGTVMHNIKKKNNMFGCSCLHLMMGSAVLMPTYKLYELDSGSGWLIIKLCS